MKENLIYDFYFSEKGKQRRIEHSSFINEDRYKPIYFKGQEYTEMIREGITPITDHFGDLVFLGKGTYEDVQHNISEQINEK